MEFGEDQRERKSRQNSFENLDRGRITREGPMRSMHLATILMILVSGIHTAEPAHILEKLTDRTNMSG